MTITLVIAPELDNSNFRKHNHAQKPEEIWSHYAAVRSVLHADIGKAPSISCYGNGFLGTLLQAYNSHLDVVLRADDIWITILTQLSYFVNAHAEKLQSRLVGFSGKRELIVHQNGDVFTADWPKMFAQLQVKLIDNVKDDLKWMTEPFSTTTPIDELVFRGALLSTYQTFFDYTCHMECGIRQVTLLGTAQDYESLLARIPLLLQFDIAEKPEFRHWVAKLQEVLKEFVSTARGERNIDFWSPLHLSE